MFSQSRLHTAYETFICYKKKKGFWIISKNFEWCFDNSEPPNEEYVKTHTKISESVCKGP